MQSGRSIGYGAAYVALSPGSLSEASISDIDHKNLPWLLVVSRQDPYLTKIVQALRKKSRSAEFLELSGKEHATDLLEAKPELTEYIALWFRYNLVRWNKREQE